MISSRVDAAEAMSDQDRWRDLPLVVDLDDTLLLTDSLAESAIALMLRRPLSLLVAIGRGWGGLARFKSEIVRRSDLDPAGLPFHPEVLAYLDAAAAAGASLHLVTAADQTIADRIAARWPMFETVTGSDGQLNLKGPAKADYLRRIFPDGFAYMGDSRADLQVWARAQGVIVVAGQKKRADFRRRGLKIDLWIKRPSPHLRDWLAALRVHQWIKNVLIFVPLVLSHRWFESGQVLRASAGFLILGVAISGTYLINDLADLAADRAHPTKRHRPMASGAIPVLTAAAVAVAAIGSGIFAAALLDRGFLLVLLSYLGISFLYSIRLKREPLVDILTIGGLFALRVVGGMVLIGQPISLWLSSFAMVFFSSLAMAKRHAELVRLSSHGGRQTLGRGYQPGDLPLTLAFGMATAMAAILLLLLYVQLEAAATGLYGQVQHLFLAPMVMASWLMRIWLKAHRGELADDPVIFAIHDRVSWMHACALSVLWAMAVYPPAT